MGGLRGREVCVLDKVHFGEACEGAGLSICRPHVGHTHTSGQRKHGYGREERTRSEKRREGKRKREREGEEGRERDC